jgi:hypothetical protein
MWRKGTLLKNTCETIHIYSIFMWNLILIMHFNYYQFTYVHKDYNVINMLNHKIDLGGLLLVVPHPTIISITILSVRLQKGK